MNEFNSHDDMNIHLSGLIGVLPVQHRRPRVDETEADFRDATFIYRVRYVTDNKKQKKMISVVTRLFLYMVLDEVN